MQSTPASPGAQHAAARRPPPGLIGASLVIARHAGLPGLRGRRALLLFSFGMLPVVIAGLMLAFRPEAAGIDNFVDLTGIFHLQLVLPVSLLFLAAGALGDDRESGTLLYLRLCPVPRGAIVVGRFLGVVLSTAVLFVPAMALHFLVMVGGHDPSLLVEEAHVLGGLLLILGLAAAAYTALFLLFAVLWKRATLFGVFFVFGWEVAASLVPTHAALYTVSFHANALLTHVTSEGREIHERLGEFTRMGMLPEWTTSVLGCVVATGLLLALAGVLLERKELLDSGPDAAA